MKFSMRHIAVAALPLLFVAAAHAQSEGNNKDKPDMQAPVVGAAASRAEVIEQLDQARAKGQLLHNDSDPVMVQPVASAVSRETVKQELAEYIASSRSAYESSRDSDSAS
jgi:hypothetical protein